MDSVEMVGFGKVGVLCETGSGRASRRGAAEYWFGRRDARYPFTTLLVSSERGKEWSRSPLRSFCSIPDGSYPFVQNLGGWWVNSPQKYGRGPCFHSSTDARWPLQIPTLFLFVAADMSKSFLFRRLLYLVDVFELQKSSSNFWSISSIFVRGKINQVKLRASIVFVFNIFSYLRIQERRRRPTLIWGEKMRNKTRIWGEARGKRQKGLKGVNGWIINTGLNATPYTEFLLFLILVDLLDFIP